MVILPVISGAFINQFFRKHRDMYHRCFLWFRWFIILIVGFILAVKRDSILENWQSYIASVVLLRTGGFILGYCLAPRIGPSRRCT